MTTADDIRRMYRYPRNGSPDDAIRVTHRLGTVWYAGRDRVLPPSPALASEPWCQFAVIPASQTDGVEDRLVVCDAELARHALAWVRDAEANRDNIFLRVARDLELIARVERVYGTSTAVFLSGVLRAPLSNAHFEVRQIRVDGTVLDRGTLAAARASLGL